MKLNLSTAGRSPSKSPGKGKGTFPTTPNSIDKQKRALLSKIKFLIE
jgi:hypothetical protein